MTSPKPTIFVPHKRPRDFVRNPQKSTLSRPLVYVPLKKPRDLSKIVQEKDQADKRIEELEKKLRELELERDLHLSGYLALRKAQDGLAAACKRAPKTKRNQIVEQIVESLIRAETNPDVLVQIIGEMMELN